MAASLSAAPCALLVGCAVMGCAEKELGGATLERRSVRVGAIERTYELYVPGRRAASPRPLFLAFHGTGESGREMRETTGLARHADRTGFLVAFPDAAVGNWAEGCGCTRADELGVNDTGFVRALVEDIAARYPIDRARVVAVGFSQGGLFVHRLACDLADVVTIVVSIAAPISTPLARRCRPSRPVSVVVAMGTLDDAYPYEGRAGGNRSTLGARETAAFWRTLDGCGPMADGVAVSDVLWQRWDDCAGGSAVTLYTVEGARHAWRLSRALDTDKIVADLARNPRVPPRP